MIPTSTRRDRCQTRNTTGLATATKARLQTMVVCVLLLLAAGGNARAQTGMMTEISVTKIAVRNGMMVVSGVQNGSSSDANPFPLVHVWANGFHGVSEPNAIEFTVALPAWKVNLGSNSALKVTALQTGFNCIASRSYSGSEIQALMDDNHLSNR